MNLLEKAQKIIVVEKSLTETLEKVEPWLLSNRGKSILPSIPRVRPLPTNMTQVEQVLAVARNLAARTSAPAGWNPNAPVVGFSTPAPLPHQLRGGALAALQLERARQAERDKKKKKRMREEEELKKSAEEAKMEIAESDAGKSDAGDSVAARDPKRREVQNMEHQLEQPRTARPNALAVRFAVHPTAEQQVDVSMNLSDSSSDEED